MQQFVGMKAALHQQFRLAATYREHGTRGGRMAMRRVDDRRETQIEPCFVRDLVNLRGRPDQYRLDESKPRGVERALERRLIAGMRHRGGDRIKAGTMREAKNGGEVPCRMDPRFRTGNPERFVVPSVAP